MSEIKFFEFDDALNLESGKTLSRFKLAYQTFGNLNADQSNVIWIIHALTANSDPTQWWPEVVGPNKAIDPKEHFIICANSLGSHYGSTHPLDIDPNTEKKYYHNFPLLTNRDIVEGYIALRKHLGISSIKLLIGASLGGQQAMEWAFMEQTKILSLTLIATNAKHSPYAIAFNESQRLAIQADQTWKEEKDDAGKFGLLAARSIALLSYRTAEGYNTTQKDNEEKTDQYKVSSYQKYQGEKLVKRFNAFSYWVLSKAMDSHDIGRKRGGLANALSQIKASTIVIGITSDVLFPLNEQKFIAANIPEARYHEISSTLGHDGFLTESHKVSEILDSVLKAKAKPLLKKVS